MYISETACGVDGGWSRMDVQYQEIGIYCSMSTALIFRAGAGEGVELPVYIEGTYVSFPAFSDSTFESLLCIGFCHDFRFSHTRCCFGLVS